MPKSKAGFEQCWSFMTGFVTGFIWLTSPDFFALFEDVRENSITFAIFCEVFTKSSTLPKIWGCQDLGPWGGPGWPNVQEITVGIYRVLSRYVKNELCRGNPLHMSPLNNQLGGQTVCMQVSMTSMYVARPGSSVFRTLHCRTWKGATSLESFIFPHIHVLPSIDIYLLITSQNSKRLGVAPWLGVRCELALQEGSIEHECHLAANETLRSMGKGNGEKQVGNCGKETQD